jgi:lysophospholipase L1-like esterase
MQRAKDDPPRRLRRVLLGAASCTAAILLALALAEAYFRITSQGPRFTSVQDALEFSATEHPDPTTGPEMAMKGLVRASANPDMIYELKPNLCCIYKGAPLETNSEGYRDREWTLVKAERTIRIAAIGDSVQFGPYLPIEKCYLRLLEDHFNAKANASPGLPRVETMNFAVPGYNSHQEAAMIREKVLLYAPDVLVVSYVGNDDQLPSFIEEISDQGGSSGLLPRSHLYQKIVSRSRARNRQLAREQPELALSEHIPERYRRMCGWPAVDRALRSISATARERGIKTLLTLYESEAGPAHEPNPRAGRHDAIARLTAEVGMERLDFLEIFGRVARERGWKDIVPLWLGPNNGHLNDVGHRLFASELARKLEDLGWVGPVALSSRPDDHDGK